VGVLKVESWQLLAAAGLVLALAEFFTPTFFTLPAGLAFIATAVWALFIESGVALLLVLAIHLTIVYFVFYKLVWPKLSKTAPKTNADAMAGKVATVVEAVEPDSGAGEVRLYGDRFRVVASRAFAVGTKVVITATDGNKVIIRALEEGER
jgi:membrane protein implicated in regulation of membrane protease activity